MRRHGRPLRVLLAFGLLAALAVGGLKWYLSSAGASRRVASALRDMLGADVEVDQASIGLYGGSTVRGLRLPEPGDASRQLLAVDEVETDLALGGAMSGAMPGRLTLSGVRVTVRFDKDGNLLTRLPESGEAGGRVLPRVMVRDLTLRVEQEGRPAMVVAASRADLAREGEALKITGDIDDSFWGRWALAASHGDQGTEATLKTASADVTLKKLRSLPFVPPSVWDEVQVEGASPVKVDLKRAAGEERVRYRVEAAPPSATVSVRAIDLTATQAAGGVVVEDNVVRLKGVKGKAAGGTIETSGDLDFRAEASRLKLDVAVARLDVGKLPASWGVPAKTGRLTGKADLDLTVRGGRVTAEGAGQGKVTGVEFAGGTGTIDLRLHGDGGRLRFMSATPVMHLEEQGESPPARLVEGLTSAAARSVAAVGSFTSRAIDLGNRAARRVADVAAKAGRPPAPGEQPTYLDANLSFEDVQLGQLAERLEIKLPVPVAGRLSFRLAVRLPVNTPRDLKAYRLDGDIDLPTLRVADVDAEVVKARLRYRDGVLRLTELSARLPAGKGTPGTIRGTASLGVEPRGELTFRLDVADAPLARLDAFLPAARRGLAGSASGKVSASVPFDRLGDPARWSGEASLTSANAAWSGARVTDLDAAARLRGGVLSVEKLRARVYGGEVTGTATLPLDRAGTARLDLKNVDVGEAVRALADASFGVEGKLSGKVAATVTPAGGVSADVDVTAPDLRVRRVNAERLTGKLRYRDGRVDYDLRADALGGKVRLDGQLPAAPKKADGPGGSVSLRGVALPRLLAALGLPGAGRGLRDAVIDADMPYRLAASGRPVGVAMIQVRRLALGELGLPSELQARVQLAEEGVRLRNSRLQLGAGSVTVSLLYPYRGRGEFELALSDVESAGLAALVSGAEDALRGRVSGRVRATYNGEWAGGGGLRMARGQVAGVDVAEWRFPFRFAFSPASGRGRLDAPESAARVGDGRAVLRLSALWDGGGTGARVDGSLRLIDARLGAFAGATGDISRYAAGRVNGEVDFNGSNVRSLGDLTGTIAARFEQAQALRLPVLSVLTPFVGRGGEAQFQNGVLRATLGGGVVRIQRLELAGRTLELFIEGAVNLQGALDLEATARVLPSGGCDLVALRAVALVIPAAGAVPVGVLARATQLLADRLIYLRITGTIRSPQVRVQPLRILTEGAARFFVTGLLGPAALLAR